MVSCTFQTAETATPSDTLLSIVGIGTWEWDIPGNLIRYNDEYLKIVGYSQSYVNSSLDEWKSMRHPDDLPRSLQLIEDYLSGKTLSYTCQIRLKHRDGHYIWTRDTGKIIAYDAAGTPTKMIGGNLRIDDLKQSEKQLAEALETLEHNHISLESAVEKHTMEMVEQGKLLWTVNQISKNYSPFNPVEILKDWYRIVCAYWVKASIKTGFIFGRIVRMRSAELVARRFTNGFAASHPCKAMRGSKKSPMMICPPFARRLTTTGA